MCEVKSVSLLPASDDLLLTAYMSSDTLLNASFFMPGNVAHPAAGYRSDVRLPIDDDVGNPGVRAQRVERIVPLELEGEFIGAIRL